MHLEITVDIQASPDVVWRVVRDVERWPEWTPSVTSVRLIDGGPLAIGSRAEVKQPKLGTAEWRITELDDARRSFAWDTRSPGVRVHGWHGVEATPGGSRATLSLDFTGLIGPIIGRLTRKLSERYLGYEAAGLKRRSESLQREMPASA